MFGNFIKDPREVAVDSCIHTRNIFDATNWGPKADSTNKLGPGFKYRLEGSSSGSRSVFGQQILRSLLGQKRDCLRRSLMSLVSAFSLKPVSNSLTEGHLETFTHSPYFPEGRKHGVGVWVEFVWSEGESLFQSSGSSTGTRPPPSH